MYDRNVGGSNPPVHIPLVEGLTSLHSTMSGRDGESSNGKTQDC